MYLHLGQGVVVHERDIIGVFDMDNTTASYRTRAFLDRAERRGEVELAAADLPKAFVLCARRGEAQRVYLTQVSPATLRGRAESGEFFIPKSEVNYG